MNYANQRTRRAPKAVPALNGPRKLFSWFIKRQESSIMLFLLGYATVVAIINPVFLSFPNLINVFRSTGFTLIAVAGTTFVLLTAGLDLSIGGVFALGAIVSGLAMKNQMPIAIAILLGAVVGMAIGGINGWVIVKTGIPPLIVTFGMQYVSRGLVSIITRGVPVYPLPKAFNTIESFRFFGVLPMVIPFSLGLVMLFHLLLKHTVFGRSLYAIGGNEEAARVSGIPIGRTKIAVYVISSLLAAVAGILMSSRLGSAEPAAGVGFELKVVAGAIIGGTSTFGGMGSMLGAALGALFMEVMTNSLTLMRISVYWQDLVFGTLLVASVLIDQYRRKLLLYHSVKSMACNQAKDCAEPGVDTPEVLHE